MGCCGRIWVAAELALHQHLLTDVVTRVQPF